METPSLINEQGYAASLDLAGKCGRQAKVPEELPLSANPNIHSCQCRLYSSHIVEDAGQWQKQQSAFGFEANLKFPLR
jgi:hypothetical protein